MSVWIIDPDHSVASFTVRHMMVCTVHGQINGVSGKILFDPAVPEQASVEATIEVGGIHTGVRKRDDHLLSPDFFDAATYPVITYTSTRVEGRGDNRFTVVGDLTIRGVPRQVVLEGEFSGPITSPFGGETTIGFMASTVIDRTDFGVSWNEPMDDGGMVAGTRVSLCLDVEADLAE